MSPPLTNGWVFNLTTTPDHSNAAKLVSAATIFSGISLIALLTRFYCRWRMLKAKGADDAATALSFVVGTAYCANAIFQTRWGLGLDVDDIPSENVIEFQKIQYVGGPLYAIGILGFKLSLLLAYLRFAGFQRHYRIILWTVIILATLNSVIFAFVFAFTCTPPAKTWNRELPGTCLDELTFYFAIAGTSIGFDLLIIGLPFPILKKLQLDARKKIGIGFLFGLGIFVTIVQILRLQTIANLKVYTESQKPVMWSMIEIHVGVIIACIPTYTPLLRRMRSKITTYSHSHGKSEGFRGEAGEVKVNKTPSFGFKSGGKSKMTGSRISAMMDDEIALCDAPNGALGHGWSGENADMVRWTLRTMRALAPVTLVQRQMLKGWETSR